MKPAVLTCNVLLFLLFFSAASVVSADVIDSFTAPQGPFTVGPGEELSEQEAVVSNPDILGGFRAALPTVDELAEPGSTATMKILGGAFDCTVDFPSLANDDNFAACGSAYARGTGPVFDLTGSTRFLFDVQLVQGSMYLVVLVVDANGEASLGYLPLKKSSRKRCPVPISIPVVTAKAAS
jgi:hypothetical protein